MEALRDTVLRILTPRLETLGLDPREIRDDTGLIELGLVDSFGFLDLLLEVESETGLEVDLSDLDPGEFTSLGGLVRCLCGPGGKP